MKTLEGQELHLLHLKAKQQHQCKVKSKTRKSEVSVTLENSQQQQQVYFQVKYSLHVKLVPAIRDGYSRRVQEKKENSIIYIYIVRFVELDYLVEDIYCYSEFHASCEAIIRQLPKITDT